MDDNLPPLLAAPARRAIPHAVIDWGDPGSDWAVHALVVVRSAWDYPRRLAAFVAWIDRVAAVTRLENPPALLRWSAEKRYPRDEAAAHVSRLHGGGRVAMAPPYLSRVEGARGETALVFIDGAFSHAARKGPLMPGLSVIGGLFVQEDIRPSAPTAREMDVAAGALAAIPGDDPPLYARVDLVPDDAGRPAVLELELVEPSLFLARGPGAADRMAAAVEARLTARSSDPG